VIVLSMAAVIGAFNGMLCASLAIHPLIVTLGVGTAVIGLVQLWTRGFPTGSAPRWVTDFVSLGASTGPIPFPPLVLFVLLLIVVISILLTRTMLGQRIYALGSSPTAAVLAGVRPVRMWATTFAISAAKTALTGILLLGFTGGALASAGQNYLFETIAAVVIGGTSLMGGRGTYVGTALGAFVLVELNTLFRGLGLEQSLVQVALGGVIILLVALYGRDSHVRQQI
jgi:ribose transport system permease protein